jgi:hypothetical protein
MNPWIGVALIGVGIVADVVLTLTHNQVPSLVASVVIAGVGVVQSVAHARARAATPLPRPANPDTAIVLGGPALAGSCRVHNGQSKS